MSRPSEPHRNSYEYRPVRDSWPKAVFLGRLFPSTAHLMVIGQASGSGKRSSRDWDQAQAHEQSWGHNRCKRRKGVDIIPSQSSSAFWDNLSEVHLTSTALRELHLRNSITHSHRTHPSKVPRPVIRSLARLDEGSQTLIVADQYTRQCSLSTKTNLKRFA